jgi:subtilisin family serine protease
MNRVIWIALLWLMCAFPINAQQRIIVRTPLGEAVLRSACNLLNCDVRWGLGDPQSELFLVTLPVNLNLDPLRNSLMLLAGVVNIEVDYQASVSQTTRSIPPFLHQSNPVPYFGSSSRYGYVYQPATEIVRLHDTHNNFGVRGAGVVAIIDTGVDPDHPTLSRVLLPGYDFTRNRSSGSEKADLTQSTAAVVDGGSAVFVNSDTAALVDQSTAAVVDNPGRAAFGHGTMVAGIIHLVAPQTRILPLKSFGPDGRGYTSDILRAIYKAVWSNASVINMSFSMPTGSIEMRRALSFAALANVACVASAGNEGSPSRRYPAAFPNVIAVASTDNADARSAFSNYGGEWVYVAAPGEGIVTTYPFGTFAAAWGTSFSTPFVSATVALLLDANPALTRQGAASAVAAARPVAAELGHGRLDIFQAVYRAIVNR